MRVLLTDPDLRRLLQANHFAVPDGGLAFVALRGALPLVDGACGDFEAEHALGVTDVDYTHPRCTIAQWLPAGGTLALYPGSTVPHVRYVEAARRQGGAGANRLMTGLYADYETGWHRAGSASGHAAFRYGGRQPVRRTADDLDYDLDDRVEVTWPYNNVHAGWSMGTTHGYYASAGCPVVCGYPRCAQRGSAPASGPWAQFVENAYESGLGRFPLVLLHGRDALRAAATPLGQLSARLRFGSSGELVETVQDRLRRRAFYAGAVDGDFGPATLEAVLAFQRSAFGDEGGDGVVGPVTAWALAITRWPRH